MSTPRALVLSAAIASLAACGGGGDGLAATARARWTTPAPSAPSIGSFGVASIDAANAMLGAARKTGHDARWDCADANADLRGTPVDAQARLAPLGDKPELVMVAVVMVLDSPAASHFDPQDVVDLHPTQSAHVFFHANALVSPDAHVSWTEAHAYLAALEEPNDDRATLETLVEPLRTDLTRFVHAAGSAACDVPITTDADLGRLGYELDRDKRETFLAGFAAQTRQLRSTCKAVSEGAGPWSVHFSHVQAGFRNGSFVAQIRSKLSVPGGTPCLGPVDVVVAASE